MGLFRRSKDEKGGKGSGDASAASRADTGKRTGTAADATSHPSSPQRVGIVSGVLTTSSTLAADGPSPFADVVARRFGPGRRDDDPGRGGERAPADAAARDSARAGAAADPSAERVDPVDVLDLDDSDQPTLEVDSMAHIGRATTITGNIVAEEDLEIAGSVEGSVHLPSHRVTVAAEGHVAASVEAEVVIVYGRITGDVVAADLVQIEKGGIVGGDVRAPRVIMKDGAIVVGSLDMSAALPKELPERGAATGARKAGPAAPRKTDATAPSPARPERVIVKPAAAATTTPATKAGVEGASAPADGPHPARDRDVIETPGS